ncbi:DUF7504 family protein [Halorientalis pallida]|uniref:Uncharacterized protein n=1 Tax=Halorientalis pallida TaxID=2479928 RepID=A0A498L110_9EURY|nr:hypothetical protein [Halorientalis pallida]RXK49021.1 hypothetical protein EAF64_08800 [Halorientalis pallida]
MSAISAAAKVPGVLSGLKRRGGGILVVGAAGEQQRLCDRLLGSSDRERVVVGSQDSCLTASCTRDATVVQGQPAQATACRAGAVLQSSSLADRVTAAIDEHSHGLAPAELRVCLGPVAPDTLQAKSVFLDAVLEKIGVVNALGHVHVSEPYDSDLVRRLEPLFDAIVQVRDDPRPRQRWHFPEHGVTTDWVDLG